jgi:hypothetical protein
MSLFGLGCSGFDGHTPEGLEEILGLQMQSFPFIYIFTLQSETLLFHICTNFTNSFKHKISPEECYTCSSHLTRNTVCLIEQAFSCMGRNAGCFIWQSFATKMNCEEKMQSEYEVKISGLTGSNGQPSFIFNDKT